MTNNFLLLNSEKTEVLIIRPKNHTSNNLEHCLTLDGCSLDSSSSVRNLGVLFDNNLSFDKKLGKTCTRETCALVCKGRSGVCLVSALKHVRLQAMSSWLAVRFSMTSVT